MKLSNPYEAPTAHQQFRARYKPLGLLLDIPLLFMILFICATLPRNAANAVSVAVSSASSWYDLKNTYYAGEAILFLNSAIEFSVAAVAMVGILSMFSVWVSARPSDQLRRAYRTFRRCLCLGMVLYVLLANLAYSLMVWRNHGLNWEYLGLLFVASVMSYPVTMSGRGYASMIARVWAKVATILRLRPPRKTPDNNTMHTESRAARLLKTMSFAAAR